MSVAAWGANGTGQLGIRDNDGTGKAWITLVPDFDLHCPVFVASGYFHSLVVTASGTVYTAGKNDNSQLGRDGSEDKWERVSTLETVTVASAAAGIDFSIFVSAEGRLYACGAGHRGQLGMGRDYIADGIRIPRAIKGLGNLPVHMVVCGNRHCLALARDTRVFSWGEGTDGQLGDGQFVSRHTPEVVVDLTGKGVISVAAGASFSLALTGADHLYTFGSNSHGQLGLGDTRMRLRPTLVRLLEGKQITQVVAGDFHTMARTRTGHLFGWGSNQCGQLGLGYKTEKILLPTENALILEVGRVSDVAVGRRHTVGLAQTVEDDDNQTIIAFAFGANNMGQLGLDADHPASRRSEILHPVRLKRVSAMAPVKFIAGGNHTILIFGDEINPPIDTSPDVVPSSKPIKIPKSTEDESHHPKRTAITHAHTSPLLVRKQILAAAARDCLEPCHGMATSPVCIVNPSVVQTLSQTSPAVLIQQIELFFSSVGCLNAAFINHEEIAQRHQKLPYPSIDMKLVRNTYTSLIQASDACLHAVERGLKSMVLRISENSFSTSADYVFVLTVLEFPLLLQSSQCTSILEALVRFLASTPDDAKPAIMSMYNDTDSKYFFRAVKVLQNYLTYLESSPTSAESALVTAIALSWMYAGNERHHIIRYEPFYNDTIGSTPEKLATLIQWMRSPSKVFSYCMFPFLLTPAVKSELLRDCNIAMMANQMAAQAVFSGQLSCLKLAVRRSRILQDTMDQLTSKPRIAWTLPLRVEFKDEEGVDEGGIVKEYFQLIIPKIYTRAFEPLEQDGMRWFWFSSPTPERLKAYHTMGLLLGLALHNSVLVEPLFPLVFYKMLLTDMGDENSLTLEDLQSLAPEVARGLKQLLDYSDRNEREVFGLTFEITVPDVDGKMVTYPLKEGGEDIPVTCFNKIEYVSAYVNYYIYGRCAASFDAFKEGFLSVCKGTRALHMLRPEELEIILCGNPDWDLTDVEKATTYVNFSPTDDVIKWFWEIVHAFSGQMKKKFLAFLTGSSRVPVRKASAVRVVIQKSGNDENRLPAAHTCFSVLDLPVYSSKEQLQKKLIQAVQETEGFTLV